MITQRFLPGMEKLAEMRAEYYQERAYQRTLPITAGGYRTPLTDPLPNFSGFQTRRAVAKCLPYRNIDESRELSRLGNNLYQWSPTITHLTEAMVRFVVGPQITYVAKKRRTKCDVGSGDVQTFVDEMNCIINELHDAMDWTALQNETVRRRHREGDVFRRVRYDEDTGIVRVEFVEFYLVAQPSSYFNINQMAARMRHTVSELTELAEFGIYYDSEKVSPGVERTLYDKPLFYFVVVEPRYASKDRPSLERVEADLIQHSKFGVDLNDPRGTTPWFRIFCNAIGIKETQDGAREMAYARLANAVLEKADNMVSDSEFDSLVSGRAKEQEELQKMGEPFAKGGRQITKGTEIEMPSMNLSAGDIVALIEDDKMSCGQVINAPDWLTFSRSNMGARDTSAIASRPWNQRIVNEQNIIADLDRGLIWQTFKNRLNLSDEAFAELKRSIAIEPMGFMDPTTDRNTEIATHISLVNAGGQSSAGLSRVAGLDPDIVAQEIADEQDAAQAFGPGLEQPTGEQPPESADDRAGNLVPRTESNGCGANAPGGGGFQKGNTCAKGGDGASTADRGGISDVEAEGLFHRIKKTGGFTYQPIDDTSPDGGYALSTSPEFETVFDADEITEDDVFNYLKRHRDVFDDPAKFAGGWHDTEAGKIYLDISHVTSDRAEAIALAQQHNQEGIFDLGNFETIIVKEAESRRLEARQRRARTTKRHQRRRAKKNGQADSQAAQRLESCGANAPGGGGFQKGNTCARSRAKKGGEIGLNEEFYKGGQFLPSTTLPKRYRERRDRLAKSHGADAPKGLVPLKGNLEYGIILQHGDGGGTTVNEQYLEYQNYSEEAKEQARSVAKDLTSNPDKKHFDPIEISHFLTRGHVAKLAEEGSQIPQVAVDMWASTDIEKRELGLIPWEEGVPEKFRDADVLNAAIRDARKLKTREAINKYGEDAGSPRTKAELIDRLVSFRLGTENRTESCGANAPGGGGFQKGNTCAKGDGGGGGTPRSHARQAQDKRFEEWNQLERELADINAELEEVQSGDWLDRVNEIHRKLLDIPPRKHALDEENELRDQLEAELRKATGRDLEERRQEIQNRIAQLEHDQELAELRAAHPALAKAEERLDDLREAKKTAKDQLDKARQESLDAGDAFRALPDIKDDGSNLEEVQAARALRDETEEAYQDALNAYDEANAAYDRFADRVHLERVKAQPPDEDIRFSDEDAARLDDMWSDFDEVELHSTSEDALTDLTFESYVDQTWRDWEDSAAESVAYDYRFQIEDEVSDDPDFAREAAVRMAEDGQLPITPESAAVQFAETGNYAGDFDPNTLEFVDESTFAFRPDESRETKTSIVRQMFDERIEEETESEIDRRVDDWINSEDASEMIEEQSRAEAEGNWEANMSSDQKLSWAEENAKDTLDNWSTLETPETWTPFSKSGASAEDYKRTQAIARYLQGERSWELMGERDVPVVNGTHADAVKALGRTVWSQWKRDSSSPLGNALKIAAAEEFGSVQRRRTVENRENILREAHLEFEDQHGGDVIFDTPSDFLEGMKAYARGTWESSQYVLDKANADEVTAWRGILLPGDAVEKTSKRKVGSLTQLPDIQLRRNAVQSFTTKPSVANSWNGVGNKPKNPERVVVRATVEPNDVLSLPVHGQNIQDEEEVVMMGTRWEDWDAWHKKAPTEGTAGNG